MKKTLFVLIAFICLGVNAFAQNQYDTQILFDDEKLNIKQTNSRIELAGKYRSSSDLYFSNKTNFEMEVTVSYKITKYFWNPAKEITDNYTKKIFKLKPHGYDSVMAYNADGDARLYFIELVHYKVIQKNYEIK
jgi:hypothetical protein